MKSTKHTNYHIDVTPEEDSLYKDLLQTKTKALIPKSLKVFLVVTGFHLLLVGGILIISTFSAQAVENHKIQEDQNFISSNATEVIKEQNSLNATSTFNATIQQTKEQKFTKNYTIKQGDTIYSIARKYKLNVNRLIKINNIKDPNKIEIGQTLLFF